MVPSCSNWLSLAITGSLPVSLCDSHSGSLWLPCSNWLSQAFTGSLRLLLDLSLSLFGSLWLSVTPTLAPTDTHCHCLTYPGPLWLIIAHICFKSCKTVLLLHVSSCKFHFFLSCVFLLYSCKVRRTLSEDAIDHG